MVGHASEHEDYESQTVSRDLFGKAETHRPGAHVELAVLGCSPGEAVVAVHASSFSGLTSRSGALLAELWIAHPRLGRREFGEEAEEHRERFAPLQPGLLTEDNHSAPSEYRVEKS